MGVRPLLAMPPSPLPPSRPPATPWSPPTTPPSSRPPLTRDPSPLPLRPTKSPSRLTNPESSLDPLAEPSSTMVSSPSDTEPRTVPLTTSSRTLGVPPGEPLDTSRSELSPAPVSAESRSSPFNPPPTERPLIWLVLLSLVQHHPHPSLLYFA